MHSDPDTAASAETVYLQQLCEDSRELRRTAEQLRLSSQSLRTLSKAAVARAQASRSQAMNCCTWSVRYKRTASQCAQATLNVHGRFDVKRSLPALGSSHTANFAEQAAQTKPK